MYLHRSSSLWIFKLLIYNISSLCPANTNKHDQMHCAADLGNRKCLHSQGRFACHRENQVSLTKTSKTKSPVTSINFPFTGSQNKYFFWEHCWQWRLWVGPPCDKSAIIYCGMLCTLESDIFVKNLLHEPQSLQSKIKTFELNPVESDSKHKLNTM